MSNPHEQLRRRVVLIAGNPRPESRTAAAGALLAERIGARTDSAVQSIDLAGTRDADWAGLAGGQSTTGDVVARASTIVLASPTYRGSYTGLLKSFLDWLPSGALKRTWVFALMTGASPRHAMSGDGDLRKVVAELGGAFPAPALFVTEAELAEADWLESWWDQWEWTMPRSG